MAQDEKFIICDGAGNAIATLTAGSVNGVNTLLVNGRPIVTVDPPAPPKPVVAAPVKVAEVKKKK